MDHEGNLVSRKVKYNPVSHTAFRKKKHHSVCECFFYEIQLHQMVSPFVDILLLWVGDQEGYSASVHSHTRKPSKLA